MTKNSKDPTLEWLLDPGEPGVRYLALRDMLRLPAEDVALRTARRAAHQHGPIAVVLEAMQPEGYWVKRGPGYAPKYFSTVWSLILLAQLGACVQEDERIRRAGEYLLDHSMVRGGLLTISGTPSSTIDCLQGNLIWALRELGLEDPRLEAAEHWLSISTTGQGVAPEGSKGVEPRYYSGKCGPGFACGANDKQPCAWGAVKVMLALGQTPPERRTPEMQAAVQVGLDFLLGTNPAEASYPHAYASKPSGNWWKFGFPVFYVTDILQLAQAVVAVGCGGDPRLLPALDLIAAKADPHGRWALEYHYAGKTHLDFGPRRLSNKWVTLRARRVLQGARYPMPEQPHN
jgi:hypothetical protein